MTNTKCIYNITSWLYYIYRMFDNSIPLGAYALVGVIAVVLSYTLVAEGSSSAGEPSTYTSSLPSMSSLLPTNLIPTAQANPVSPAPVVAVPEAAPGIMGGVKKKKTRRHHKKQNKSKKSKK